MILSLGSFKIFLTEMLKHDRAHFLNDATSPKNRVSLEIIIMELQIIL